MSKLWFWVSLSWMFMEMGEMKTMSKLWFWVSLFWFWVSLFWLSIGFLLGNILGEYQGTKKTLGTPIDSFDHLKDGEVYRSDSTKNDYREIYRRTSEGHYGESHIVRFRSNPPPEHCIFTVKNGQIVTSDSQKILDGFKELALENEWEPHLRFENIEFFYRMKTDRGSRSEVSYTYFGGRVYAKLDAPEIVNDDTLKEQISVANDLKIITHYLKSLNDSNP